MQGPTFITPETVIQKYKDGTLDPRQGIVALAREVISLREHSSLYGEKSCSKQMGRYRMNEQELLLELAAQLEEHPTVEFFVEDTNGNEKRIYISDVKFTDGVVKVVLSSG